MNPNPEQARAFPPAERFDESGVLVIDKPAGITSMDVIRNLKRVIRPKRIGHGGTLDPFATGVLPILINQATRLSQSIMDSDKEYEGVLQLGATYDTQDVTGTLLSEAPIPEGLKLAQICELAAQEFVGEISQAPPLYSAVKRSGRPLYDYARAGESIEVEPRKVFVESFELLEWLDVRRISFRVKCKKGVYVRTLVHDLGQRLGCGAVVESLRRLQTGGYRIESALNLGTLKFPSDIRQHLKSDFSRAFGPNSLGS